jgi:hypothetical protein
MFGADGALAEEATRTQIDAALAAFITRINS